jgi:hypothetical protein
MLQSPTSHTKRRGGQSKANQEPQPEHQLHPRLGVTAAQGWSSGAGGESAPTPAAAQGRDRWGGLQRAYGNQAVLRALQSGLTLGALGGLSQRQPVVHNRGLSSRLQTKLTINTPGDQYEQEADRVAEQVMRMPDPSQALTAPVLQRKCACGGGGSGTCSECAQKEELQRSAAVPAAVPEAPPIVHDVLGQPGRPLDASTRAFFEPRFGRDLSSVRVHTDSHAAKSAQSVRALAYTVGRDVVFGSHEYAPNTPSGRLLLAHELTHMVQQGSGRPFVQRKADAITAPSELQTPAAPTKPPESLGSAAAPMSTSPAAPACAAVPPATPATCAARHTGYCDAARCFPDNRFLNCVCSTSQGICDAVDAFHLDITSSYGRGLLACLPSIALLSSPEIVAKGDWFLNTNQCIWGHWRAALDALHDPLRPIPSGLTPEWTAAVSTCRAKGLTSADCCAAHVEAEQQAIDTCGPYDSKKFGTQPTDVPPAPACSLAAYLIAPGPAFTGDFGVVADRIKYGKSRCCS